MQRIIVPRYDAGILGLPASGQAVVFSNSERSEAACDRRWWFRYVEGLSSPSTRPQSWGTAWHAILETIHRWWMETDAPWPMTGDHVCPFCAGTGWRRVVLTTKAACVECAGTGAGILTRIRRQLLAATTGTQDRPPMLTADEVDEMADGLQRALEGWIRTYGVEVYRSVQVVAVEVALARQVVDPRTGTAYQPEVLVVDRSPGVVALAGTGEVGSARVVRWPWYQVSRLDAVLRGRKSPVLHVGEWKSSGAARDLIEGLSVDPQTAGYCWVLAAHTERFHGSSVVGSLYDVTSTSYQYDTAPLKAEKVAVVDPATGQPLKHKSRIVWELDPTTGDPIERVAGLSQRRDRNTPSWRYLAAIKAAGFDPADYTEHLAYLAQHVDPKLYIRDFPSAGQDNLDRYGAEVYAEAVRFAAMRRAAARARDATDLDVAFPRTPVCRLPGGSCPFRGPCLADGPDARREFETGPGLSWVDEKALAKAKQEDLGW